MINNNNNNNNNNNDKFTFKKKTNEFKHDKETKAQSEKLKSLKLKA